MNALALALVRNEADLIEAFVRHHAPLVDLLVLADQGSRDGTHEILLALQAEGLPLLLVDVPELALEPATVLSAVYRRVAPIYQPELVYLLGADTFVRHPGRAALEAELAALPPGSTAALSRWTYRPDAQALATPWPGVEPMTALRERGSQATPCHAVLRRDPADDTRLVLRPDGEPVLRQHGDALETLPGYSTASASLAHWPVRGVEQFTTKVVYGWETHKAQHADQPELRASYLWRPWLDQVLAGRGLAPETLADAARLADAAAQPAGLQPVQATVLDPLTLHGGPRRLSALARLEPVVPLMTGLRWPALPGLSMCLPTGEAVDLAPVRALVDRLGARRAIVMATPTWSADLAEVCPQLMQHVPREGEPDVPVDLVLVPAMPADLLPILAEAARPELVGRIAFWPAQPWTAGALDAELGLWQAHGWAPDLGQTLALRALGSYADTRQRALVLAPLDTTRPERTEAIRQVLVALDAAPAAPWKEPAPTRIDHPLQALLVQDLAREAGPAEPAASAAAAPVAPVAPVAPAVRVAPVAPAAPAQAAAPVAAPAAPVFSLPTAMAPQAMASAAAPRGGSPRSVLIAGAGRSGTSCLAGMFSPETHRHAHGLYAPQISNPKGFFEAAHINDLNEALMVAASVAFEGAEATRERLRGFEPHQLWLARFPDAMPAWWNDDYRRQIAAALPGRPFCLKDPRMAITAPAWLEQAPDALVLSIHRPPEVTAASILKECQVATYLLDFRISARDAFALWRQTYRRLVRLYRAGAEVRFLRYQDLFDAGRLSQLEAQVGAPLRRDFAEGSLNRTSNTHLQVAPEFTALHRLLEALSERTFLGDRAGDERLIDAYLQAWPDEASPRPHAAPVAV